MKTRTTKKEIKSRYTTIKVSYCAIQTLLSCEDAIYYTAGICGWNADIYTFGKVAIVTGYDPFGEYKASHELCKKYEKQAEEIVNNYRFTDYEIKNAELRKLIDEFIAEVIK